MNEQTKLDRLYVGCDPGFTAPCICVLGNEDEPLAVKFIDGTEFKMFDDYSRAFNIGMQMAKFVVDHWGQTPVILAIEGPSYGSSFRSSSMEQMALCRQAIYDAFERVTDLIDWHQIAPATAKKAITGSGRADKETVVAFARILGPKTMEGHETFRKVKKRNGTIEQQLNAETSAIADAFSIAIAGKRKWET